MPATNIPRMPYLSVPLFRGSSSEEQKRRSTNSTSKAHRDSLQTNENSTTRNTSYKPEKKHLCKYFVKNACIRGRNCTFSHVLSKFPCKLFHLRKNCRRRNCPFSHAPISEEEAKMLISDGWEVEKEEKEENFVSPFL